jgi:hypothetical protein
VFQCVVCACDLCISQEDESNAGGLDDDVDGDADMSEVRAAVLRMARAAWC